VLAHLGNVRACRSRHRPIARRKSPQSTVHDSNDQIYETPLPCYSTGSGTCSHYGGVREWLYENYSRPLSDDASWRLTWIQLFYLAPIIIGRPARLAEDTIWSGEACTPIGFVVDVHGYFAGLSGAGSFQSPFAIIRIIANALELSAQSDDNSQKPPNGSLGDWTRANPNQTAPGFQDPETGRTTVPDGMSNDTERGAWNGTPAG
jgi:hypothetical protein